MPPVGRIPTPGPARHSLAPSRWAGPQSAAERRLRSWTLLGSSKVSGPAVSASLAGPSASDAAGDSTMGTNWASPFSVSASER